jgi:hypothetical protein
MIIELRAINEIDRLLKRMYDMSLREDWNESSAQELIIHGGDLYVEYFKNQTGNNLCSEK